MIVFDVNETLLDLAALDPIFTRIFGDAGVRRASFQQMLQSAFVSTITGAYQDFRTLGGGALGMVAVRRGVSLSGADGEELRETMRYDVTCAVASGGPTGGSQQATTTKGKPMTIGEDQTAQTLPDITLPLVTGGELRFRDLRGKRRLLFMWGSW